MGTTQVSCTASDAVGQAASCEFSIQVLKPPKLKYTKFMAFGDSITEGEIGAVSRFRIVDPTKAYPTLLQQMLAARYTAQTVTVTNEGEGGESATDAVGRLQNLLATRHPQVVILSEGTNDLNGGSSHIYPAADAMEDMARRIVESGAVAIVGTVPPMRAGFPKAGCPDCVVPYNARVVTLATRRGARIVDIYRVLKAHITTLIGDDGIHPTAAGYEAMATAYFNAIVKWFGPDPGGADAAGQAGYVDHH